jgi:uncharacterized protein YndB with AHSA1/START domain
VASNHVYIAAAPATVWEVLVDARSYAHWVVGSSQTRGVTGRWPAVGSRFHHTQGVGPLGLRDDTEVIEAKRPRRLVLEVRSARCWWRASSSRSPATATARSSR